MMDEFPQNQDSLYPYSVSSDIDFKRAYQWFRLERSRHGGYVAEYVVLVETGEKVYKESERIDLNVKSIVDVNAQLSIAKKRMLKDLFNRLIDDTPDLEVENFLNP